MNSLGLSPLAVPIAASGLLLVLLQSDGVRGRARRMSRRTPVVLDLCLLTTLGALVAAAFGRSPDVRTLAGAGAYILLDNLRFAAAGAWASPFAAAVPAIAIMALGIALVALGWPRDADAGIALQPAVDQNREGRECECGCGRRLPPEAPAQRKYFDSRCRRSAAKARPRGKAPARRRIAA